METLERLEIKGTPSTPEVVFEIDGNLLLKGRIIPDNAFYLFKPLIDWVKDLESRKVTFDIDVEYLNTNASMQLYTLLKSLDENPCIEELTVIWHYDEDDDDHLETGQFYQDRLARIKFLYKAVA